MLTNIEATAMLQHVPGDAKPERKSSQNLKAVTGLSVKENNPGGPAADYDSLVRVGILRLL
jgi:hypothetical protein